MCSSFMLASVEMTLTRSAAPANKQCGHRHLGISKTVFAPESVSETMDGAGHTCKV